MYDAIMVYGLGETTYGIGGTLSPYAETPIGQPYHHYGNITELCVGSIGTTLYWISLGNPIEYYRNGSE